MSGDEACDLTTELTDEIQKLPENIIRAEKALKTETLKYENLLQLKPNILKVKDLKEALPKKKEELKQVEELLGETVSEYETILALIGEPTHNMELANSMMGDMTLLDEALKESARLEKDLELQKVGYFSILNELIFNSLFLGQVTSILRFKCFNGCFASGEESGI